uniref:PKD domain-containing protein n=1 Tax=Podarcis muralis TaxID=64176 RepID=A0A670IT97_PODMU
IFRPGYWDGNYASWTRGTCQPGKALQGGHLRSLDGVHLQLLEGFHSVQSCQATCCQSPTCDAFWLKGKMCIQVNCIKPHWCQAIWTNTTDSILVFVKRSEHTINVQPAAERRGYLPKWLDWREGHQSKTRMRRSFKELLAYRAHLADIRGRSLKRDTGSNSGGPVAHPAPSQPLDSKSTHNDLTEAPSSHQETNLPRNHIDPEKNLLPNSEDLRTTKFKSSSPPSSNNSNPVVPTNPAVQPSTAAPTPVIKKLAVSAGDSVEVTLPKNEVELNAYVLPPPPKGTSYSYDWRLITHPTDYSGEMEGQHSQILKLSKLTVGLYEFNVIVDGDNAHGEGMVNVTVKPEPRVNQPPVAIVLPQFLEISLPTTSTVIDGSHSTDDDKIVSYHWEELKGPLREEKVSADTAILKLTNLVPGNYTFSLTVVDSDGASNSTTASLTVNKAVDYPPVANAGPNQVITLPQNSITLYGNQSTDDHGIVSYEWSLSPSSKGKVVEMQGVRTSTLQLSAMREGDYTYLLTVTDSAGHQSTAEVTVIVQPENNKPPKADAGPDKELTLPVDSTTLDGSKSSDDQKIASFLWEKTRGPDGVKLENANSSIATVTGLEVGTYEFTLTVKDERNLQSQSSVNVIVKEEINKPPTAKIAGNVVITLPTNTAELDGSRSTDDKGIVAFLWTRDDVSPAAGEVLNNSDHHAVLFLSNLVEGTYSFHLKVTDAKGESDMDRATVEVKPDPRKNNLVEMILDVNVSQRQPPHKIFARNN